MGMLNRQSREQRKLMRDNRDAVRELDMAEAERRDFAPARGREDDGRGRAASNPDMPARVLVGGREVMPGQPVMKLPTLPERGEKTRVESVEATKVMPQMSDLDRQLAKLPTAKPSGTELNGPSV